jgi:integrase
MPLKLYRRGDIWYYSGTVGPRGRRKRFRDQSCFTRDKDTAARQVAEVEAQYWKGHFDGPAAILMFSDAARAYRAAGKSPRFLDKVEAYFGQTLVKDITEGSIHIMAKTLYPNATGASLNRMAVSPAQAVINHAAKSKLCPPIRVERYKIAEKVKDIATLEWVEEFRKHAPTHVGTLALFMYLTGARVGEAIDLKWDDVDLVKRTALIRESKQNKERVSHLPQPLVVALSNLERIEGRGVFCYKRAPDQHNAWERAIERAGIKRLTPHSCRHGFATGLLRRGVDVVTVAWLGGWRTAAQVLKTYGHANKDPRLVELLLDAQTVQALDDEKLSSMRA